MFNIKYQDSSMDIQVYTYIAIPIYLPPEFETSQVTLKKVKKSHQFMRMLSKSVHDQVLSEVKLKYFICPNKRTDPK